MTDSTADATTLDGTAMQTEQPTTVEINGEQVSIDELKAGYFRQKDYTQKTQELAEERKRIEELRAWNASDEDKAADAYLQQRTQKNGVLTQAQLDARLAEQRQELEFDRFIDNNPQMAQYKDALKTLWKGSDKAWDDLAVQYGFSTSDKLSKAKGSRDVKGMPNKEAPKEKTLKDLSPEEYAAWKATVPKSDTRSKKI